MKNPPKNPHYHKTLETFHTYMGKKLGKLKLEKGIWYIVITPQVEDELTEAVKLRRLRFLQTHRHLVNGMGWNGEDQITRIECKPPL